MIPQIVLWDFIGARGCYQRNGVMVHPVVPSYCNIPYLTVSHAHGLITEIEVPEQTIKDQACSGSTAIKIMQLRMQGPKISQDKAADSRSVNPDQGAVITLVGAVLCIHFYNSPQLGSVRLHASVAVFCGPVMHGKVAKGPAIRVSRDKHNVFTVTRFKLVEDHRAYFVGVADTCLVVPNNSVPILVRSGRRDTRIDLY
nr:hypothetical protein CFP56_12867 [Quercus suber]